MERKWQRQLLSPLPFTSPSSSPPLFVFLSCLLLLFLPFSSVCFVEKISINVLNSPTIERTFQYLCSSKMWMLFYCVEFALTESKGKRSEKKERALLRKNQLTAKGHTAISINHTSNEPAPNANTE